MLLSIETSCDESAVALHDEQGVLLCDLVSSQVALHIPYGGVVPELAARAHLSNLQLLVDEIEQRHSGFASQLKAVAVTQGPGLKGCLLVGLSFAKAFAFRLGIPVIPVNHLEGHLLAGDLLPESQRPKFPYLALLVSGGHSQIVLVRKFRDYEVLAETLDDAVGEAFDKCATLLGLPYPGGPALSRVAEQGDAKRYDFPIGVPHDQAGFSFSGLKTAVSREVRKHQGHISEDERANLAASVEKALVDSLVPKTKMFAKRYAVRHVLLTGGVAANRRLRAELKDSLGPEGIETVILPQNWCGDNAAMIGCVGLYVLKDPQASLADERWFSADARPRFPLSELTHG